jgi:pimeloyl-ACP methyl ester carboxylesterase
MRNPGYVLFLILWLCSLTTGHLLAQHTTVYLFPGQGSDERLFKNLVFPPGFDTVHISYPVPEKREDLHTYAMRFVQGIDTTHPYVLLGVSLGGMICTELSDTLSPEVTILISSAKCRAELPGRYTFLKQFPLNRILPKRLIKGGGRVLQGIVEPDRKYDKETFQSMLKQKDPLYLKRTIDMIVHWDRDTYSGRIIHLHGNKDHTIPVKNVRVDYLVEGGSHMMTLTRAGEISEILGNILHPQGQK